MGCSGSFDRAGGGGDARGAAHGKRSPTVRRQTYELAKASWAELEAMADLSKEDRQKISSIQNSEYRAKMRFLEGVPLLRGLPKEEHPKLALCCTSVRCRNGGVLFEQGDSADKFYIIRSGEAIAVVTDDRGQREQVAVLRPGDYFGEAALLRDEPRSATVLATSELILYTISREHFWKLKLNERLQFAMRHAVAGGVSSSSSKTPTPKTKAEIVLIAKAIKSNRNLQTFVTLDEARLGRFIDLMWKEVVPAGHEVMKEGDFEAHHFYVVQEGSFEILHGGRRGPRSGDMLCDAAAGELLGVVGKGGSFGELALLYFVPRAATVRARERSQVWVVDRQKFKSILQEASEGEIQRYVGYLDRVAVMHCLLAEEKERVAKALIEMHFRRGECIIRQGEPGNNFYILYDGEVGIVRDGAELSRLSVCPELGDAEYFGELALLEDERRTATVVVASEAARCLVLDRESFRMLLCPLRDLIDGSRRPGALGAGPGGALARGPAPCPERRRILRKDLKKVGLLGVGSCSTVELWEHADTQETYAVKTVGKGFIMRANLQDVVLNEKDVFMRVSSPFIIRLLETYNGGQSMYFVLEIALGGELYTTYRRKGLYGSPKHAKYYIAGTVLALEHMHDRKIIYRDLKPENVLLNSEGHLKLTDMGLAKFVVGRTYTTCGTPDYFAPEMITMSGHHSALDWWALGIFLFELMSGRTPFESHFPMQVYRKVQKGIQKVPFPSKCQGDVASLIRNLLVNEPSSRLPMRPGGVDNIRQHKWYADYDWRLMARLELEPPYKPVVLSSTDMSNFSVRPEDVPAGHTYYDPGTGWDKDFATA